ncbi:M48 family metallopeptidase [Schwartzia succinivorans]|jgi:hypothetical protein|uniref:Peptidase family M48 n=1 Tax=Schwartzia succinivorans DSM 10502 TaxID=1123243 RepID=A0A1M5ABX6_9FIRM|nr:M48 family metallopeptidase [Schwartzia succinivorans]SHF27800.1 hypothetical protein SAMN02745190_02274 [Schwartzia succinivorans DSM 10502]
MEQTPKYFHFAYAEQMDEYKKLIPCPEAIIKCYMEYEGKIKVPDLLGKTVRVTAHQIPELHTRIKRIADMTGIDTPDVFLYEDFYYGVQAKGITSPRIEISAKTVTDLSEEEFDFLVAREMCRIKHDMVKWALVGEQYFNMVGKIDIIPGVDTLSKTFQLVYANWMRVADYSADCYGYDVVKDIRPCVRAILALILNNVSLASQVNVKEYIGQAADIYQLDDVVYRFSENDEKVPYGPLRIRTLLAYAVKSVMN